METGDINFFTEDIEFTPSNSQSIIDWLSHLVEANDFRLEVLNYIFCSDEYLHTINLQYLNHDTYTDIITFDNSEEERVIEGDIFISIDRINDNSQVLRVPFDEELHRVMAHGLIHLMGQGDKTEEEKKAMTEKENMCLSLRSGFIDFKKRST